MKCFLKKKKSKLGILKFRDKSPSFQDLFKCWGKFCEIITGSCKLLLEIQSIPTKKNPRRLRHVDRDIYSAYYWSHRLFSATVFLGLRCMMLVKRLISVEDCNEKYRVITQFEICVIC